MSKIISRAALVGALFSALLTACSDSSNNNNDQNPDILKEDRAFYILPPGNYGGIPTNENSLDQLPLYLSLIHI